MQKIITTPFQMAHFSLTIFGHLSNNHILSGWGKTVCLSCSLYLISFFESFVRIFSWGFPSSYRRTLTEESCARGDICLNHSLFLINSFEEEYFEDFLNLKNLRSLVASGSHNFLTIHITFYLRTVWSSTSKKSVAFLPQVFTI